MFFHSPRIIIFQPIQKSITILFAHIILTLRLVMANATISLPNIIHSCKISITPIYYITPKKWSKHLNFHLHTKSRTNYYPSTFSLIVHRASAMEPRYIPSKGNNAWVLVRLSKRQNTLAHKGALNMPRSSRSGGGEASNRGSAAQTSNDLGRYVSKVMINTILVIERAVSNAHGQAECYRSPRMYSIGDSLERGTRDRSVGW